MTSIGGQAVMEGVMMRSGTSMATAVRDADGVIRIESKRLKKNKSKILRFPIIRGVVAFFQSLVGGTKVLMRSAEVYGEGEPSRFEKWCSEKLKIDVMNVVVFFSMLLGLALAVFLFMWLPVFVRGLLERWFGITFGIWAKNFIEGGLKLLVFITYLLLCSLIPDVKRTFMYHGAEHKTISCYEKELELTPENAAKCTRVHDRCGTTFMVFVLVISIIVFAVTESLIGGAVEGVFRILLKIALLPVVAGLSYELLKFLAKTRNPIFYPLKVPGLLLQRITTKEPTTDMLEVAIAAFDKVLMMDEDESIPEENFYIPKTREDILREVRKKLKENGIDEEAEAEWIVSLSLGIKRDEVRDKKTVSEDGEKKILALLNERITGRPLWYCVGNTDFYGYELNVDERALIPRPETEQLVSCALEELKDGQTALDLCTGSGAIAIVLNKEKNIKVTATDISEDALSLAKENAEKVGAEAEFIRSDMFSELKGRKFDAIITNPPYIKRDDIAELQKEVKDFEPRLALDGGEDGLEYYRIIASRAAEHLNDGGKLLMECGYDQAWEIVKMLDKFKKVQVIKDYENKERIVKAEL